MKRLPFILFLTLLTLSSVGRELASYHPFAEQDKVWTPREGYGWPFFISGDTLIGGLSCMKMYWGAIRDGRYLMSVYDDNGTVRFFPVGETVPLLLYDFTAQEGDTVTVGDPWYFLYKQQGEDSWQTMSWQHSVIVTANMELTMNGHDMHVVCFRDEYDIEAEGRIPADMGWNYSFWIEGIGSPAQPANPVGNSYSLRPSYPNPPFLASCSVGGEEIYSCRDNPASLIQEIRYGYSYTRPLVEEGKHWLVALGQGFGQPLSGIKTFTLGGDTIVGGKACLKMFCRLQLAGEEASVPEYMGALREQERKVFFYASGHTEEWLLYDFNLEPGMSTELVSADEADCGSRLSSFMLYSRRSDTRRSLWVYPETSLMDIDYSAYFVQPASATSVNKTFQWTEGIGSVISPLANLRPSSGSDIFGEHVCACWVGDTFIYGSKAEAEQTMAEIDTGIHGTMQPYIRTTVGHHIFDLSGRHLAAPPSRGLYIEDGKVKAK